MQQKRAVCVLVVDALVSAPDAVRGLNLLSRSVLRLLAGKITGRSPQSAASECKNYDERLASWLNTGLPTYISDGKLPENPLPQQRWVDNYWLLRSVTDLCVLIGQALAALSPYYLGAVAL